MIHGLGGGLPCFYKNYPHLCRDRKVYGIDLPGFALSSRVKFPEDPTKCLEKMVDLLEKWRRRKKIKKLILLGHSFGGYLSAAYAVAHSSRVRHLVLVDPWGMVSKKEDHRKDPALWEKAAMAVSKKLHTNPFSLVRESATLSEQIVFEISFKILNYNSQLTDIKLPDISRSFPESFSLEFIKGLVK